jgi:hypothetical protein
MENQEFEERTNEIFIAYDDGYERRALRLLLNLLWLLNTEIQRLKKQK